MAFTSRIPEYTIDLTLNESTRWNHVIRSEAKTAALLVDNALADFEIGLMVIRKLGGWPSKILEGAYAAMGGLCKQEMRTWADSLGVDRGLFLACQCSYEMNFVGERIAEFASLPGTWKRGPACTAGIIQTAGAGMVHVRNMDWNLKGMGKATRLFRFRKGQREFVTVGATGLLGVLSGMLPGAYSVTINYAPFARWPSMAGFGPLFLLRHVFETCDTYDEAVETLSTTVLSSPVFFTVCGAEPGQGCVIERTRKEYMVRQYNGRPLVQANHYVSDELLNNNEAIAKPYDPGCESLLEDSVGRYNELYNGLAEKLDTEDSLEEVSTVLDCEPVLNECTCQQMVFCPADGKILAWRKK